MPAPSNPLNLTSFDSALKVYYTSDKVKNLVLKDNPFLAMVAKGTTFTGRNMPIPLTIGNPQGVAGDFAAAQANAVSSRTEAFTITRKHAYGVVNIDNETMEASASDKGAWFAARTNEIDGILLSVTRKIATDCYGTGTGLLGTVTAYTTGDTFFTLVDINDITNFSLGMRLTYSLTDGGAAGAGGATAMFVSALNYDLGRVTLSLTQGGAAAPISTTFTALTTGVTAFMYRFGANMITPGAMPLSGIRGWVPDSAPTSTLFNGLDRTPDPALGGLRFDASALSIEEGLQKAAHKCKQFGAKVDTVFMNPVPYGDLMISQAGKVVIENVVVKANIGFEAIVLQTPAGKVRIVSDANCPSTRAFMLKMDTWKLWSLGDAPKVLDSDGLRVLRNPTEDSVQVRTGYYAELACSAPGWNMNIRL